MEKTTNFIDFYDKRTKILDIPPINIDISLLDGGLGWFLYKKMKQHDSKIFLIVANTNQHFTYNTLLKRAISIALDLKKRGLNEKSNVLLGLARDINLYPILIAVHFIGAKVICVDCNMTEFESRFILNQIIPDLIILSNENEIITKWYSTTNALIVSSYIADELNNQENFEPYYHKDLNETCLILFTSGSTGAAKGCELPHKYFANIFPFENDDVTVNLHFGNPHWIFTHIHLPYAAWKGLWYLLASPFDPKEMWDYIRTYKNFGFMLTPTAAKLMYKCKPEKTDHLSVSLMGIYGSECCTKDLELYAQMFPNAKVFNGYGSSETSNVFKLHKIKVGDSKNRSAGKPIVGKCYKVVDCATGDNLGFNEIGELCIKSDIMFKKYISDEETKKSIDSEGFFKTGDLFYYDEDFYFYFIGRAKSMFKYNMHPIQPEKIESVICTHPDVEAALVIGIPDEIYDNFAKALVILKYGAKINENDLAAYVNGKTDDVHKLRAGVTFVKEFKLNANNKVDRNATREEFLKLNF